MSNGGSMSPRHKRPSVKIANESNVEKILKQGIKRYGNKGQSCFNPEYESMKPIKQQGKMRMYNIGLNPTNEDWMKSKMKHK